MPGKMPKWLEAIPDEKLRQQIWEKAHKEWVPMADFTKATQAKADELKQALERAAALEAENKRFMEWYYGTYEPWKDQVQPILQRYSDADPTATPADPASQPANGNWWKYWDVRSPQQREKLVLPLTLALMVVAVTFPPWRIVNPWRQQSIRQGFAFLLEPPSNTAYIDWNFLVVELLLIGLVGGLVWVFIRGNRN